MLFQLFIFTLLGLFFSLQFWFCLLNIDFSVYLLPIALLECLLHCQISLKLTFHANKIPKVSTTKLCKVCESLCLHINFSMLLLFLSFFLFQVCFFETPSFICSPLTDLLSGYFVFSVLINSIVRENYYQPSAIFNRRSQSFPCVSVDTCVHECLCERLLL